MNKQVRMVAGAALAITAAAAFYLGTQQSRQRLGKPGLITDSQPMYAAEVGSSTNPPVLLTNRSRVYLPTNVLDFYSQQAPMPMATVNGLPKDTSFGHRVYGHTNGLFIDLQVVLMGSDRSSIHKPQYCLLGSGFTWQQEIPSTVRITRPHTYDLPVMRMNLQRMARDAQGNVRQEAGVFVYWFVADGELTAHHHQRMWWIARDMITTGVLQRWAYVICFAPCAPGTEDETFERIQQFIADAVPQFHITTGPALGQRAEVH